MTKKGSKKSSANFTLSKDQQKVQTKRDQIKDEDFDELKTLDVSKVIELDLYDKALSNFNIKQISQCNWAQLKLLRLTLNSISDQGCKYLSTMHLPSLKRLIIGKADPKQQRTILAMREFSIQANQSGNVVQYQQTKTHQPLTVFSIFQSHPFGLINTIKVKIADADLCSTYNQLSLDGCLYILLWDCPLSSLQLTTTGMMPWELNQLNQLAYHRFPDRQSFMIH